MWTKSTLIFFTFSQIKQFATQKQILRVQETVFEKPADSFKLDYFTLPDSLKIPQIHVRLF